MSYIRIVCTEDANPKYNRIQLRTNPPTYIELQPGENILKVKNYPGLKSGFSQIDDFSFENAPKDFAEASPYEYNGGGIVEVDLSHFDASEMTSMDDMFSYMQNLKKIKFDGIENLAPISLSSTFSMMGVQMDVLDLTSMDARNVENVSYLFSGCDVKKVILSNLDFRNLKDTINMFNSCGIQELIFDGCKINDPENIEFELDTDNTVSVSLNQCDAAIVDAITSSINAYRRQSLNPKKQIFIVSSETLDSHNDYWLDEWLKINPTKTKRDWLLETRCSTNKQRQALNELLDACDEVGLRYEIGLEVSVPQEYAKYLAENQDKVDEVNNLCKGYHNVEVEVDFDSINRERLEHDGLKFIAEKRFDLYFPALCWSINVGNEVDDAVTDSIFPNMSWSEGEGSDLAIYSVDGIVKGFHLYLRNKYKAPLYKAPLYKAPLIEKQNHEFELLPWNHEIRESESIKKYGKLPFEIENVPVEAFFKKLFGDSFGVAQKQIIARRREEFLSSHASLREERDQMLHTLVLGAQNAKGTNEALEDFEIETLLETVDNELSALYPEYKQLCTL